MMSPNFWCFALMSLVCVMEVINSETTPMVDSDTVSSPKNNTRIAGGAPAKIEEYPYQVSLRLLGSHSCGGSIISEKYVITAAHCIRAPASSYSIRAGSSDIALAGIIIGVKEIFVKRDFNRETNDNDIAILLLSEELKFSDLIAPIKLPPKDRVISEGNDTFATGWGALHAGGKESEILQVVRVPIVDLVRCRHLYESRHRIVTDRMLCAGYSNGGKDACQGDSGGPLMFDHELIGISSWGIGCGRQDTPGVYTNILKFRDYIKQITGI